MKVKRCLILFACLVAATLILAGPTWADWEWLYTHGHSGHIQDESAVTGFAPVGGGLYFSLSKTSVWVHFAVPSKTLSYSTTAATTSQWKVRYLRLKFGTGSSDVRVTKIHVYDGNVRFKTIEKAWADSWSGDQDLVIDLGAKWKIYRGLGVSIEVDRGVENMDHGVQFRAVGARWEQ